MHEYKTFKQLKTLAKQQMQGNMGTLISALIVQELILFLASALVTTLVSGSDPVSNTIYYVITFIIQLLSGLLQAGCCLMFLHCACQMTFNIGDLFHCFKNSPDKTIKVEFGLAAINLICMLPSDIVLMRSNTLDYETMMMTSLVTIGCMFAYMIVTLGLFPVFYMMFDFPQFTVKEIYQKSWEVMNGHKLRYFLLQLSFIPYIFLSMFTCGIALLWVIPYMNMTCTNFYLDIMAGYNKQN